MMTDHTPNATVPALDAALAYAEEGLRVLPTYWPDPNEPGGCACGKASCSSPGKHPLTKKGVRDSTTDLDQIWKWWEAWPDANVAVEPGEEQFVVDVDPRSGGDDSLKELEAEYGPFRTKKVRTGSGGLHIWFKTQTPVRGRTGLRSGIDIKTAGGYVLMPPSLHVQGSYEFDNGSVAVPAPPGLMALAQDQGACRTQCKLTRRLRSLDRNRDKLPAAWSLLGQGSHRGTQQRYESPPAAAWQGFLADICISSTQLTMPPTHLTHKSD